MKGLRLLLKDVRAEAGHPLPSSEKPRHTLTVTGALKFHGYVCLQYAVTPVPIQLAGDTTLFEGEAGTAVDDHAGVYGKCSVAYRRSADGQKVVGSFNVAPPLRSGASTLRVLLPPLALTPDLDQALCEVELAITGDQVEPVSARWA